MCIFICIALNNVQAKILRLYFRNAIVAGCWIEPLGDLRDAFYGSPSFQWHTHAENVNSISIRVLWLKSEPRVSKLFADYIFVPKVVPIDGFQLNLVVPSLGPKQRSLLFPGSYGNFKHACQVVNCTYATHNLQKWIYRRNWYYDKRFLLPFMIFSETSHVPGPCDSKRVPEKVVLPTCWWIMWLCRRWQGYV